MAVGTVVGGVRVGTVSVTGVTSVSAVSTVVGAGGVRGDWGGVRSDRVGNGDWCPNGGYGRCGCYGYGSGGWTSGVLGDDSVEAVDAIGGVVDLPDGAVSFDEAVGALDDVTVSGLVLGFGVAGERVADGVAELVGGVGVGVGGGGGVGGRGVGGGG